MILHSDQTEAPYLMDHISSKWPMCVLKDVFFMVPKWNSNHVCSETLFSFPEYPGLKIFTIMNLNMNVIYHLGDWYAD